MQHSAWAGQPRSSVSQQVAQLIDIVAMFYPFRALNALGAHQGELPLWNPYIQSGAPFQANAQSAIFNPLGFVYWLLPLKAAWSVDLILRIFLYGLFMTLFVRTDRRVAYRFGGCRNSVRAVRFYGSVARHE